MIECYVGLIGGGKSYNAVHRMIEYMAAGGVVVTNITLKLDPWFNTSKHFIARNKTFEHEGEKVNAHGVRHLLRTRYKWEYQEGQYIHVTNDQLLEHGLNAHLPTSTGKPVLVVFDESADFWDIDDRSKADKEFLSNLRHSRKLGIDYIFIIQEMSELNKRVRNQVAWVWTFQDMETFRVPGLRLPMKYIPPFHWGTQILCNQWIRKQYEKGGKTEPVKRIWRYKEQCFFGCYQTEEMHRELNFKEGVVTDFGDAGKIKQDRDSVPFWPWLLAGCGLGNLVLLVVG